LKKLGYPASTKPHGIKYALFKLAPLKPEEKIPAIGVARAGTRRSTVVVYLNELARTKDDQAAIMHWLNNAGTPLAQNCEARVRKLIKPSLLQMLAGSTVITLHEGQMRFSDFFIHDAECAPNLSSPHVNGNAVAARPSDESGGKAGLGLFSFFSGAGFLDLGFEDAGYRSFFANEISPEFCTVYRHARERMGIAPPRFGLHEKSIDDFLDIESERSFLRDAMREARSLCNLAGFIGGPPCPDFSVAGKNRGAEGRHGRLSRSYMDLICREQPDFFVFENVKGLWRTAVHRAFYDSLVNQARKAGYATTDRLVNALEFGAPQDRDRIILVGVKRSLLPEGGQMSGEIPDFPWKAHMKYSIDDVRRLPWPARSTFGEDRPLQTPRGIHTELTVAHWFERNDVEHHENANDFFVPRAGLEKMKRFDEGDDSKKCFKRLHRWRYSPTVAYGNNEVHLHPFKARRLSAAEALSLQSLPPGFCLPPSISLSAKFKTIGNGVPYLLARGIARTIKDYFESKGII